MNVNTGLGLEAEYGFNLKYIDYLVTTPYKAKYIVSLMVYIEKFSKDGIATYHQCSTSRTTSMGLQARSQGGGSGGGVVRPPSCPSLRFCSTL